MTNTHSWVEKCLQELPERKRVIHLDRSFFMFDPRIHRGRVRIELAPAAQPDTVICTHIIDGERGGKFLLNRLYELLSENGVVIIVCRNIHPGIMRYWLKPFAWKYITVIPQMNDTCAIAGKGEKYYADSKS